MMIDFTSWNQMLRQYVDDQGLVDYAAWKAESAQELTQWLNQLATVDLQTALSSDYHLAFWLNLYNALIIAQVLNHYPSTSILPKIFGIPNWLAFFWFFQRPVCVIGGRRYSLNAIEHGILRQVFNESRIHFALVCAAIGCPLLRNKAYQPETIRSQLELDAVRFINNPTKVCYDTQTQVLYCSPIFKWYQQDFLKVSPSILVYIQTYLSPSVQLNDSIPIRYLDYDWSLNQRISS